MNPFNLWNPSTLLSLCENLKSQTTDVDTPSEGRVEEYQAFMALASNPELFHSYHTHPYNRTKGSFHVTLPHFWTISFQGGQQETLTLTIRDRERVERPSERDREKEREGEVTLHCAHALTHIPSWSNSGIVVWDAILSLFFLWGWSKRCAHMHNTHTHTQRALALLTLWGSTLPCAPPSNCSQKNLTNRQKCVTPLDQQQDRESQCYLMDLQTSGPPLQPDPHRTGGWRRRWPPRGSHVYPMGSLSNSLQNTSRQKQEMIQILQ